MKRKKRKHVHIRRKAIDTFWADYAKYMESPEWRKKRGQVLQRAHYCCERCQQREATNVHHLSYAHVFQEKLYELQAVCHECHEKLHPTRILA